MGRTLTGLAWDHRRCWGPLEASIPGYLAAHSGLAIRWDRRSLYEFGEGRLEDVVRSYDLVLLDHPFIGDAARDGLLVPFDPYLSEDVRQQFAAESVGRSWESYQAHGRQWALPIDAAAQVASYRPDLLDRLGATVPRTHAEAVALGRKARAAGKWLGLPLVPTDAMCLILTGAATGGHRIGGLGEAFLAEPALAEILDRLRELAGLAHPSSWSWNPIRCYDHMVAADDVVYVPFAFGYVNYASRGEAPHLRFADIPASPPIGSLLGGAGIGVSAFSQEREAAAAYAIHLCGREFQRRDYVAAGGQPGTLSAWTDAADNRATRGFFQDTLATLQGAYLRGTYPGFVAFFRACAPTAQAAIRGEVSARELAAWLNDRHAAIAGGTIARSYA
jgi:multiple sugar transport system substrate-binding protein